MSSNYWYRREVGDINNFKIKKLVYEKGTDAYYIYERLVDLSISSDGLIRLDRKNIACALDMYSDKKIKVLCDVLDYLLDIELVEYENNTFVVPVVRSRIGSEENILLNSQSITIDEELNALIGNCNVELNFVDYCELDDIEINKALLDLAKRYPAREILRAVKEFATDYENSKKNMKENIIENRAKYLKGAIYLKLRTPAQKPDDVVRNRFAELCVEQEYFEILEDGFKVYDVLIQKYEPKDIIYFLNEYFINTQFNEKEIKNKAGNLVSVLTKMLKGKRGN